MDWKKDIRDFLVSRRARVTPEQVGLPDFGGERRVPGLRREEVAMLAGVSVDYYTRLERGNIGGASDSVLDAIARALLLNDAERAHLFDLARAVPATVRKRRPQQPLKQVRTSVQRVLDSMGTPAIVENTAQDIVAANPLGRALYAPHFDADQQPNVARFIFLDPRAQDFYVDWELARRTTAAMLRREIGRNPLDADLTALIGELSARSATFVKDWSNHNVHVHRTGSKTFRHPEVGLIDVDFDVFEMPADSGLIIVTYSVAPGTSSADAMALLATLAATDSAAKKTPHAASPAPDSGKPAQR
jgi:transcriptional regulator with XRE-family HTH domain